MKRLAALFIAAIAVGPVIAEQATSNQNPQMRRIRASRRPTLGPGEMWGAKNLVVRQLTRWPT